MTAVREHPHSRIEVTSSCTECGFEYGRASFDRRELSRREVESQQTAELPDREALSLVNANLALPVNLAVAANVLSDGSIAYADATQVTPIDQST
jgi:hypothetical protein